MIFLSVTTEVMMCMGITMAQHLGQFFKLNFMDNPRKKKEDGKRVSKQTHEVDYQKKKAAKKSSTSNEGRSSMRSAPESGAERSGGR